MLDRTQQPEIHLAKKVNLPPTNTIMLENGIKLMSLTAGTQDVLRLTIVFRAGTRYQAVPFAASATLNMLSEGSEKMSSAEIANTLDFYGIYYDTNIDRDFSMITVSCLNKFLPQTIDLLDQILLHPTFDPEELSTYATKRKQSIKIEREKPSFVAREELSKALFGAEHPYGVVSSEDLYDDLTATHLAEHFSKFYNAENCFAVASGMIGDGELKAISDFLSKMPTGHNASATYAVPQAQSTREVRIEREGAVQSSLRMGKVLFHKGHPDYNSIQVLSVILGGYFGSRLVSNLREEKGYTYGVYSAMVTLEHSGYFAIATDVASQYREDSEKQIKIEMERLRTELVSEEELDMVRNTIIGEMMRLADGPFGIADITIESEQCGKDNEMINQFLEEIAMMTPQKLMQLAIKYLDPETFVTVTVG